MAVEGGAVTEMEYRPIPVPARVGQGTAVEQSRAAAEVMAAVQVALQFPRDVQRSLAEMRAACATKYLAEKAFFSFNRGDGYVNGPTIQLARELARCWGNIHYGLSELRRDDEFGQSEMQAWAWDLQSNERVSTTFIVPHGRDVKGGEIKALKSLRDVYENNANNGARRLREMIYAVLPQWFREEAEQICRQALQGNVRMNPEQQRAWLLGAFAELSVTREQLEQHRGRPVDQWLVADIETLKVLNKEIRNNEVSIADVFGAPPVTDEELKAPKQPSGTAQSWGAVQYGKPAENPAVPDEQADGWPEVRQPGSER